MPASNPQLMDPWSTHLPLLAKAVGLTDGPVLEIGSGMYSTPVLHGFCRNRQLVTLESDRNWAERFAHLACDRHQIHVGPYQQFDALIRDTRWSVVLIDHSMDRRKVDALKVTTAELVIFHDTNQAKFYGLERVLPLYRRRCTCKRLDPWTTVATNDMSAALDEMFPTVDDDSTEWT